MTRSFNIEPTNVVFELNGKSIAFTILQDCTWRYLTPVYEPEVVHVMTRFIRPGDHVVDAGANWGYHTLVMSRLVGEGGRVLSVEPDNFSLQVLNKNIQINQLTNVTVNDRPLWDQEEERDFTSLKDSGSSSLMALQQDDAITSKKHTARLDSLVSEKVPVRLLKVDCEGAEYQVLRGAARLLEEGVDAVIVELNYRVFAHFGWTVQSLRSCMKSLGYDFFLLSTNGLFPLYVPAEVEFNFSSCIVNVLFSRLETVAKNWPVVNLTSIGPVFMGTYTIKDGKMGVAGCAQ